MLAPGGSLAILNFSYRGDPELDAWAATGRPLLALVPEHDQYLTPAQARPRFARVPGCELVAVADAKHLLVGERFVRLVLDEIVARVAPPAHPLPTTWPALEDTA